MSKNEVLNLIVKLCEENNENTNTSWNQWLGAKYIMDCYKLTDDGGEVDMSGLSDKENAEILETLELCIKKNRNVYHV